MRISTRTMATVAMLGGLALLSGCGTAAASTWHDSAAGVTADGQPTTSISAPANGAADVPTSTVLTLAGAGVASPANATSPASPANAASPAGLTVTVTDPAGAPVAGALAADGATWTPTGQLKYATSYTATVSTTAGAKANTTTSTFTTMKQPPANKLIRVSTPLADDQTYGVALPIVLNFGAEVAKEQRAEVERRLQVTSEPAQVGSWNWFSGSEMHYRPQEYWQEGTKLNVRAAVGGLPLGNARYGARDLTLRATIGEKLVITVDDATHMMTVTKQDQVLRTIPVSLGKPTDKSSSGAMVIMTKNKSELFVSTEPGDSYREIVHWTQRITTSGQYIHSAPWSVADQGKRNVSHGCTNVSEQNAIWLYDLTQIGDPMIVKGTGSPLRWGNGWTDWDRSWDEYRAGSALTTG